MRRFNPRSPRGERLSTSMPSSWPARFQSTLPAWGATFYKGTVTFSPTTFQSTLPAWGATAAARPFTQTANVSIHAPRVGSDELFSTYFTARDCFNPRSPRGERQQKAAEADPRKRFQSTLPAWGATANCRWSMTTLRSFNPRSPRGERRGTWRRSPRTAPCFNPRSPRGERRRLQLDRAEAARFQSTLPAWGATNARLALSTRTLRFNPRSPRGERRRRKAAPFFPALFQSTLPAWGATAAFSSAVSGPSGFNPRSPRGERHEAVLISFG